MIKRMSFIMKIAFFLLLCQHLSSAYKTKTCLSSAEDAKTFPTQLEDLHVYDRYLVENLTIPNRAPGYENVHAYASCRTPDTIVYNCTIVREYYPINGRAEFDECHSSFNPTEVGTVAFVSLQDKKMVFLYLDPVEAMIRIIDAYFVFRTIDMETCEWHEAKIHYKSPKSISVEEATETVSVALDPHVLHYKNGSYAVYLYNPWVCKAARCRYMFDSEGNQIGEPVPYLPEAYDHHHIHVYSFTSDEKKTIAVIYNFTNPKVVTRDHPTNRHVKIALVVGSDVTDIMDFGDEVVYDFDTSNDFFSVCWRSATSINGTTIKCKLFNAVFPSTGSDSVTFDYPFGITSLSVKNSVSGPILLFNKCDGEKCYEHFLKDLSLGDFGVEEFHCAKEERRGSEPRMIISSYDDETLCISRVCHYYTDVREGEIMRKCY